MRYVPRLAVVTLLSLLCPEAIAGSWSPRTTGQMQTQVYLPDAPGAVGAGRSLLVALHGCAQPGSALKTRGGFEEAAEAWGMVVAVPSVPGGGVLFGCWDYYGANHTRGTRHDDDVLELVQALLTDPSLGLDPAQVYVAGLSSGGGEAVVLGCLAPDVFAGVGVNAGPAVGTSESQTVVVGTSAAQAEATCRRLAGAQDSLLSEQIVSIIQAPNDFIVSPRYADINAEMYVRLAGEDLTEAPFDVTALDGYEPRGEGTLWSSSAGPRVSRIFAAGLGHNFPAGTGAGTAIEFVAPEGVSWPAYLAEFFANHNPRITRTSPTPDAGPGAGEGGVAVDAGPSAGLDAGPSDAAGSGAGGSDAAGVDAAEAVEGEGCRCARPRAGFGSWALLALGLALLGRGRPRAPRRGP